MRNKLRFLAIIAVGVLLLPAMVLAQPPAAPLLFQGSVTIDGVDAPVGTIISAEVEGVEVATNVPDGIAEAGQYTLAVPNKDYTGKIVVFKADGVVGGQCEYADPMETAVVSFDLSVEVGSPPTAPPPGGTPFPGGLSRGAMIGIVVAAVVVIALIVFLVVRRRRRYG